jgi:hypothetical protein
MEIDEMDQHFEKADRPMHESCELASNVTIDSLRQ